MRRTVFQFLDGRIGRLNSGRKGQSHGPVVAGWRAPDCKPVYGHHDSSCAGTCPDKQANRMEVSLSSFRQVTHERLH